MCGNSEEERNVNGTAAQRRRVGTARRSRASRGSPGGSYREESVCSAGDPSSVPAWEDALGEEMAPHSSILAWRIPKDRGAWWATVHEVTEESDMTERASISI